MELSIFQRTNIRRLLAVGLAVLLLLWPATAVQAEGDDSAELEIEQVYINMPEIRVYFSKNDSLPTDPSKLSGFIEKDPLTCTSVMPFSETGDNIDYYVLVDVSASISGDVFRQIQAAVKQLGTRLKQNDRMLLWAFGSETKQVYRSDRPDKTLDAVVDSLRPTGGETSLYDALTKAAKTAEENFKDDYKRCVCILFTDGYDETAGKATMDEARKTLQKYNLPVYAVSAIVSSVEDNRKLGELCRETGGAIRILDSTGDITHFKKLTDSIIDDLYAGKVAVFRAASNVVDYQEKNISVQLEGRGRSLEKKAMSSHWQKDVTIPTLVSAELESKNSIRVAFSEPVMNADRAGSYTVEDESGRQLGASNASYEEKDGRYMSVVTFDEDIVKGNYKVSCKNICDVSMEKNAVANTVTVYLDGVDAPNPFVQFLLSWQGIILAIVVLVAAMVLIIVIVRVRRKAARVENKTVIQQVPVYVPAPQPQQPPAPEQERQQVIEQLEKKAPKYVVSVKETNSIFMRIELSTGEDSVSEVEFEKQLVVGRSAECDVCIDDRYMARRQFVIEKENDSYFVTDLNSTNGTSVNGIRINSRHKLERNDVITAGTIRITVSWN